MKVEKKKTPLPLTSPSRGWGTVTGNPVKGPVPQTWDVRWKKKVDQTRKAKVLGRTWGGNLRVGQKGGTSFWPCWTTSGRGNSHTIHSKSCLMKEDGEKTRKAATQKKGSVGDQKGSITLAGIRKE